jgi:nucleoside-diphosphate-sugar epimerase
LRSYGWRPRFSLKEGIADAVAWWQQQPKSG